MYLNKICFHQNVNSSVITRLKNSDYNSALLYDSIKNKMKVEKKQKL